MDGAITVYKPDHHLGTRSTRGVPCVVLDVERFGHYAAELHVAPEEYFVARLDHDVM